MDTAALHTLFGALSSRRGGESTAIELPGADLAAAHLRCADLQGANLAGARLDGAKLTGANLGGARLDAASLVNADLTGADLRWADLSGALLGGALLAAADLRGAKLPRSFSSAGSLVGARVDPSACARSGFDEEAILALASAGASFDDVASFPSPLRDALASADAVPESAARSRRPAAPDSRQMEAAPDSRRVEAAPDSRRVEAAPDSRRVEAAPDSRRVEAAPDSRRMEAAPDSRRVEAAPDSRRMEAAWSSQRVSAPPESQRIPESQRMPPATDGPRQGVAISASRRAAGEREAQAVRRAAVSGGPRRAPDASQLARSTELRLALAGGALLLVLAAAVALAKIPPRGLLLAAHAGSALGAALLTFALPLVGAERNAPRSLGARLVLAAFAATLVYGLDPSRLAVFRLRATLVSGDAAQRSTAVRLLARSGHRSFDGLDLSGLDLSRADLGQSSFRNARLAGADLSGAALMESTFGTADLTAANLRGADLTGTDAEQATGWELAVCDAATELPEEGVCLLGHPVRANQPSGDTTARSAHEGAAPAGAL
ncbi:pentapeptide repeat-containing protein [Sorangium sp. So ce117]|uniref:pentapeptide repeat-containing protein n=1 Tax=Sorangium sp. So ce117 TaxID=3133277 RepID=UPI003F5F8F01